MIIDVVQSNLQRPNEARPLFEQVITRFPKGELADDSAYALIEMSIETGDLAFAEQRFPVCQ